MTCNERDAARNIQRHSMECAHTWAYELCSMWIRDMLLLPADRWQTLFAFFHLFRLDRFFESFEFSYCWYFLFSLLFLAFE